MRKYLFLILAIFLITGIVSGLTLTNISWYDKKLLGNPTGNATFTTIRNYPGTSTAAASNTFGETYAPLGAGFTNFWDYEYRGGFVVNTTLPPASILTAAEVALVGSGDYNPKIVPSLLDLHPATQGAFIGTDFGATNFTRMAPDYLGDMSIINNTIIFQLNSDGLLHINTTGLTSFMISCNSTVDNTSPIWQATTGINSLFRPKEYASGIYSPKIILHYYNTSDNVPPESITNLTPQSVKGTTATWNYTTPNDPDFDHLYVLVNNIFYGNITSLTSSISLSNLLPKTIYLLSTKSADAAGNLNATWVNSTVTTDESVVLVGDSIIQGSAGSYRGFTSITGYLLDDKPNWSIQNSGFIARTSWQTYDNFTSDVLAYHASIVIYLSGINDIAGWNYPAVTVESNISRYQNLCAANNIKMYVNTLEPDNFTSTGNKNQILVLNNWIKTDYTNSLSGRYYFDLYALLDDPLSPGNMTPTNTTDGLHLSSEGLRYWGEGFDTNFPNITIPTPTPTTTPPTTTTIPPTTTIPTTTIPPTTTLPTPTPTPVPSGYWTIFTDNITQSSITWNMSNKAAPLTFVSLDGIALTGYDPNATIIIQSGLVGGETHSISAIANNTTATATATTRTSAGDTLINLVSDWFPIFIVLGLFAFGVWLHWLIFFIGSGVSLYFLYDWVQRYPIQTVGIGNLHFLVYAALFILGLILWLFKRKGR